MGALAAVTAVVLDSLKPIARAKWISSYAGLHSCLGGPTRSSQLSTASVGHLCSQRGAERWLTEWRPLFPLQSLRIHARQWDLQGRVTLSEAAHRSPRCPCHHSKQRAAREANSAACGRPVGPRCPLRPCHRHQRNRRPDAPGQCPPLPQRHPSGQVPLQLF